MNLTTPAARHEVAMSIAIRAPRLTSADLALLRLMWPEGARHSGPAADVFAASGNDEWPGIVVSRQHGGYAMADAAGRTSTEQRCLASMLSAEIQRYAEHHRVTA